MCDDYRVNDLQSSLDQAQFRYRKAEAELSVASARNEILERLYRDMIGQRNDCQETCLGLQTERDKWKRIATGLIHGAECQIDDLGGLRGKPNAKWTAAWYEYNKEANHD